MSILKPKDVVGDLVVEKELPNGGQAEMYLARGSRMSATFQPGKRYVLKVVSYRSQSIFLDEETLFLAKLQAGEPHQNIVELMDWGSGERIHDNTGIRIRQEPATAVRESFRCVVLEYLYGGSLQKRLEENGRMPFEEMLADGHDILSALEFIHTRQIIHLDVKPDNVLYRPHGRRDALRRLFGERTESAVLIDFGIARRVTDTLPASRGMGDPQYASPEQYAEANYPDKVPIDKRCGPSSDVFSWGVLMYACLTGKNPHGDRFMAFNTSLLERADYVPEAPSKYNKKVTPELDKVILRCLRKDPKERYATAKEALVAYDEALHTVRSGGRQLIRYAVVGTLGLVLVLGCAAIGTSAAMFIDHVDPTVTPQPTTVVLASATHALVMATTTARATTTYSTDTPEPSSMPTTLKATSTSAPTSTPTRTPTPAPPTLTPIPTATP